MNTRIRVTVWNEFRHEQRKPTVQEHYPQGIHTVIAAAIRRADVEVRTATLDEPEHGLTQDVLANTDVLIWWGHLAHDDTATSSASLIFSFSWMSFGGIWGSSRTMGLCTASGMGRRLRSGRHMAPSLYCLCCPESTPKRG